VGDNSVAAPRRGEFLRQAGETEARGGTYPAGVAAQVMGGRASGSERVFPAGERVRPAGLYRAPGSYSGDTSGGASRDAAARPTSRLDSDAQRNPPVSVRLA
jgi:hypothetical protein